MNDGSADAGNVRHRQEFFLRPVRVTDVTPELKCATSILRVTLRLMKDLKTRGIAFVTPGRDDQDYY